jgi:hypothetical protein
VIEKMVEYLLGCIDIPADLSERNWDFIPPDQKIGCLDLVDPMRV